MIGATAQDLAAAEAESSAHGSPARRFADFAWRTLDSWTWARRVVAKALACPCQTEYHLAFLYLQRAQAF